MQAGAKTLTLTVLGGSSPATPVLIDALRRSQRAGRLRDIEVRLHGRNVTRLEGIAAYASRRLAREEQRAGSSVPQLRVIAAKSLEDAFDGASDILCMVRPGGMLARAADEAIARDAASPADEGLGIGGLASYLRSREVFTGLAETAARHAPSANFLQMSGPLGVNVALTRRAFGPRAFGVCELPLTTATKLAQAVSPGGGAWASHSHAGLNHQSWMYAFRDAGGQDVTARVLDAIPAGNTLGVDSQAIREAGAVPVHYLKMYLHTAREVARQSGAESRGVTLDRWSRRIEQALVAGDDAGVDALLAERRMDWFDEGIVPVLESLQLEQPRSFPLNVPADDALPGAPRDAIVEVDCEVSVRGVTPRTVPALPAAPAALTWQLIDYERALLDLPREPGAARIAAALALHPLAPREGLLDVSRRLAAVCAEPFGLT
jgi:6-phospho-beta-glucosidase